MVVPDAPADRDRPGELERALTPVQAIASNVLVMIGVGPFLTIPFMLSTMGGPHIIYAWLAGALLALCDGLVYAQLGAALPGTGGPYVYLREAYRPFGLGRLMAFLFILQVMLVAPLSIASGAVGFADYLRFYWSSMTAAAHHLVAAAVVVAMTAALYRRIRDVGRLSILMLVVVGVTVAWVIAAGLVRFSAAQAFAFPPEAFRLDGNLAARTGAVALLAMYNYGGYNNVCNIAGEVVDPVRTIPRAIVISILIVVGLYVAMSTVIIGVVPWQEAARATAIASTFIGATIHDAGAARAASLAMTALILFVTAASLFAVILGYSRVPFAAARDGQFFAVFGRVHPTRHFPHVSLLTLGALSLPFCFLPLGQIVSWLILVQIASQFVWQCAGVMLLHRFRHDIPQPFVMWLYPLPAVAALALWASVFVAAPPEGQLFALAFVGAAVLAFGLARRRLA